MKTFALCTLIAIVAHGCAAEERQTAEPRLTSATLDEQQPTGWPSLGRNEARFIRIDLGPDSLSDCQKLSPKFPFDSAMTRAQDHEQLAALASCLNAPEMTGRTILLVGRADARGADTYNEALGMKRAAAIKQILIDHGIAASRIDVATEGKRGAVGNTPDHDPGYDRRVDIVIQGGVHTP